MTHRPIDAKAIVRAPADTLAREVAAGFEVAHDSQRRALGDADAGGDVPDPCVGLGGEAQQDMGVVREEGPAPRPVVGRACTRGVCGQAKLLANGRTVRRMVR